MAAEDVSIDLPGNFVKRCPGVAFDIGIATVNVIYRGKDDWEAFQKKGGSHTKIRFASFPVGAMDRALDFLQEKALITAEAKVNATGSQAASYVATIEAKLNVKVSLLPEMDCFVNAQEYIQQHAARPVTEYKIALTEEQVELVTSRMAEALQATTKAAETSAFAYFPDEARAYRREVYKKLGKPVLDEDKEGEKPKPAEPEDGYPGLAEMEDCGEYWPHLMVSLGTAFPYIKAPNFGQKFLLMDVNNRGGQAFMGLGSLLTGAKTFDELVALAEKGDARNVHKLSKDLGEGEDVLVRYGIVAQSWGLADGKAIGDFSKEDLAIALLISFIQDAVTSMVQLCGSPHSLKHVFLCGNFASNSFVRGVFQQLWYHRCFLNALRQGQTPVPALHIMRQGPYLAALGCLINSVNPFMERN